MAGARVKDLYEVCGQAQRSVSWKGMAARMLDRMRRREVERNQQGGTRPDRESWRRCTTSRAGSTRCRLT